MRARSGSVAVCAQHTWPGRTLAPAQDTEFHCGMLQGMADYYDHAARATQSTTSGENVDYSSKN